MAFALPLRGWVWIGALAIGLVGSRAANAALPCASPTGDCVLSSTVTIPVGLYDIRPRNLVIQNKTITISGAGEFKVLANNVTSQPGGRLIATGTDGNTTVTLDAAGFIDLQSAGTSKSKIDVSGDFGGGTINLHAVGPITINGTLIANATNLLGFGGPIAIRSETGNVTITGDPSEGIRSFGNAQGGGGSIDVDAPLAAIAVSTQLVAKGGDCASCEVNLTAGTTITTTAQGVIDLRASGIGDGGFFSATANGDILLVGNILADGSGDDLEGGTGGDILISAGGALSIGRVEVNGASPDGDGGSVDLSAVTTIQQNGPILGVSKGFGQGDEVSFDAGGNVTLAAEIDQSGDYFGGDITVLSDGLVTVSARVRTATIIDPINFPNALGGSTDIEACQINVTSTGQVIGTGPGGSPSGANFLAASTGLTITGTVTATSENDFDYRTSVPVIAPGHVTPAPVLTQDLGLPCCGVSCSTTTVTTTTTTSSTSPTPSTSSTSTTTTRSTTSSTSSTTSTSSSTSTSTSTSSTTSTSTSSTTSTSTSSTSTSTSTTTSTTLVVGCPSAPQAGCQAGTKISVLVNEKRPGKELVKVKIDRLPVDVPLAFFGDPVNGSTGYAVCLYDQTSVLRAALRVNRPGATCGTKPCWKLVGGPGYKYTDRLLASDGVLQLFTKSGLAGKAKMILKAKNDTPHGLTALPTGVAGQLLNNQHATVQMMTSNAGCLTGEVTDVRQADGLVFKGKAP